MLTSTERYAKTKKDNQKIFKLLDEIQKEGINNETFKAINNVSKKMHITDSNNLKVGLSVFTNNKFSNNVDVKENINININSNISSGAVNYSVSLF